MTDFDLNPSTICALAYMPHEALHSVPNKIDSFSIGVLLLQIATRNIPNPTAPSSPNDAGTLVQEIDRRKPDIDAVPALHGFLPIIRECLRDQSEERPSVAELRHSIEQLKNTAAYRVSSCDPSFQVFMIAECVL